MNESDVDAVAQRVSVEIDAAVVAALDGRLADPETLQEHLYA
jgi:hypothetical protein